MIDDKWGGIVGRHDERCQFRDAVRRFGRIRRVLVELMKTRDWNHVRQWSLNLGDQRTEMGNQAFFNSGLFA